MKAKTVRRLKGRIRKSHTKLMGGKSEAEKLRIQAANLRIEHDLCRCPNGDEEIAVSSEAEKLEAAKLPPSVCDACGKRRLRVFAIVGGDIQSFSENTQALIEEGLMLKNLLR